MIPTRRGRSIQEPLVKEFSRLVVRDRISGQKKAFRVVFAKGSQAGTIRLDNSKSSLTLPRQKDNTIGGGGL